MISRHICVDGVQSWQEWHSYFRVLPLWIPDGEDYYCGHWVVWQQIERKGREGYEGKIYWDYRLAPPPESPAHESSLAYLHAGEHVNVPLGD